MTGAPEVVQATGPGRTGPDPGAGSPTAFRRLRQANIALGIAHLAQAAAILAMSNDFAIAVTASFATGPPGSPPGDPSTLFEVAFGPAVAVFLLLAAIDHLTVAAPGIVARYERGLAAGRNLFRWTEYAFSASLMIVLIALLTGITDVHALIALFGVNAAMILFGWIVETTSQPGEHASWTAFLFGCVAGAVPWIAITVALIGAESDADVPGFVYGIFVSLFLFFNSFAVNMYLQYRRVGPWRSYLFGEAGYLVLSLASKSALAWQVFAGALAS